MDRARSTLRLFSYVTIMEISKRLLQAHGVKATRSGMKTEQSRNLRLRSIIQVQGSAGWRVELVCTPQATKLHDSHSLIMPTESNNKREDRFKLLGIQS